MEGYSQNVFPTSDAIWNIQINGKENYYGLSGDTIIADKFYNKLYLLNDTIISADSKDEYIGGFRQEGKMVWYRPAVSVLRYADDIPAEETVLFDFSKSVGDTVWHNLLYQGRHLYMGENITASIIHDIVDSEYGRIYKTSQYINNSYDGIIDLHTMMGKTDSWIEGIGNYGGLFWFLDYPSMAGGSSFKLACFKQGDEVKYIDNNTCNTCFCKKSEGGVGISDKIGVPLEVVSGNNNIQIRGESLIFPCELKLFSSTGQLVLEKILLSDKNEVPVRQKGICIYQIQKDGEIVKMGKIIIK